MSTFLLVVLAFVVGGGLAVALVRGAAINARPATRQLVEPRLRGADPAP